MSSNPYLGAFQPSIPLNLTFQDTLAEGNWTLEVYDSEKDNSNGFLVNWYLELDVKTCEEKYEWTQILQTDTCMKSTLVFNEETGNAGYECIIGDTSLEGNQIGNHTWPSPRYAHSSIVVQDSVFILGGFSGQKLYDLWRFDIAMNVWTSIQTSKPRIAQWIGKSAVLTSTGIYTIGGMNSMMTKSLLNANTTKYDAFDRNWSTVSELNFQTM